MYQDKNMKSTLTVTKGQWLVAILLLGLVTGLAWAAQTSAPVLDPNAAASGETIDPNQAQVDFSNGCLIKFIAFQKDSNIRDGLRLLAVLCKKNIVPSSRVDGPLTISRLYNVTFEEALKSILGYGFRYEQEGDFIKVYTAEEFKQIKEDPDRMTYKVVTLYYLTAKEAEKLIKPVMSGKGTVATSTAAMNTISGSTGSMTSGGLTANGGGDDMANNDMIVIYDYPENIEKAEGIIRDVDIRPRQVLVEATILSVRLTEDTQFGIDWNLLSGVAVDMAAPFLGGQGTPVQTAGFAAPPGSNGLTAAVSADNVQAIVTALEEITDTTLLANPKILAVNKQEGSVLIGKKLGYLDTTTQTQTSTTQSVKFLETGTRLVFRPYIGDDGYIRMDIYPKDSDGVVNVSTGIPDETTTELRTNVVVKDGATIVIGGLFRDTVTTGRRQVPVLGDIPFAGVLFRGTTDTVKREEVIIMLTPHIIKEAAETNPEQRLRDLRLKREGMKDGLQIIDRAKLAEDAYDNAARCYLEGDIEKALFNLKIALHERPTYLEALRLRDRIIAETDPEQYKKLDSVVQQEVSKQENEGWFRQ
jgi:type IV pilus assembly protein PilQ